MKISELADDRTYIICPDRTCKLFWEPDVLCSCEGKCPKQEEQKLVVKFDCGHIVVLPGGDSWARRIDHFCPDNQWPATASSYVRMSLRYTLLYDMPD